MPIVQRSKPSARKLTRCSTKLTRTVDYREIASVLERSVSAIEIAIIQTLEGCPPELASDIYLNGAYVTGGNALLRGVAERLQRKIKLPVNIDDDPLLSVLKGVAAVLRDPGSTKAF